MREETDRKYNVDENICQIIKVEIVKIMNIFLERLEQINGEISEKPGKLIQLEIKKRKSNAKIRDCRCKKMIRKNR